MKEPKRELILRFRHYQRDREDDQSAVAEPERVQGRAALDRALQEPPGVRGVPGMSLTHAHVLRNTAIYYMYT